MLDPLVVFATHPFKFVLLAFSLSFAPVLADVLARRGGPALTAHFAARAFDAQCLFECVRTWAGDCFVFGGVAGGAGAGVGIGGGTGGSGGSGAIRGLPGADAVDEAPLALTLYLLDIMVFLGALATCFVLSLSKF